MGVVLVVGALVALPAAFGWQLGARIANHGIGHASSVRTAAALAALIGETSVVAPVAAGAGWTVTFAPSITGGSAPYTCAWSSSDGGTGNSCTSYVHVYSTAVTISLTVTDHDHNQASASTMGQAMLCNSVDGCNWIAICLKSGQPWWQCYSPIHPADESGFDATFTANGPVTWSESVGGSVISTASSWGYHMGTAGTYNFVGTMTDHSGTQYTMPNSVTIS